MSVPQDRDGIFEPKVVKKRQKDISGNEQKIISLYVKGMTTRQISETIEYIYGFEVSDGMVSDITDRLLPQIEEWLKRPLDEVYPKYLDKLQYPLYTVKIRAANFFKPLQYNVFITVAEFTEIFSQSRFLQKFLKAYKYNDNHCDLLSY